MSLIRLFAKNFRNLTDTDLHFNSGVNLFYGQNGSGKTSILEAVYFLSSGKTLYIRSVTKFVGFLKKLEDSVSPPPKIIRQSEDNRK